MEDRYEEDNIFDDDSPDPTPEEIPEPYRNLSIAFSKKEADKLPP